MDNNQHISNHFNNCFETLGEEALSKYRLSSPQEIEEVFKELISAKEIITVHVKDSDATLLTTMLDILPQKRSFSFAKSPDEEINAKIANSKHLFFEAKIHQVEIRFSSEKGISPSLSDETRFNAPIPEFLYHLQRRDYFRVETSTTNPVTCHIPDNGGSTLYKLFDISVGGISISDPDNKINEDLSLLDILPNCTLHIPEFGDIELELEIRSVNEKRENLKTIRRFGLAYKRLSGHNQKIIQCYINKRQMDLHAPETTTG